MFKSVRCFVMILTALSLTGAVLADDLTDASEILCSVSVATLCDAYGECEIGMPWTWNIPEFIEIDLALKTLATTEASGQGRSTSIRNLELEDQQIIVQGAEHGRAFSVSIQKQTGRASFAVAADGFSISAFGACTPMNSTK